MIKALPSTPLELKWVIKNTSKNRSWPVYPEIKNFSKDLPKEIAEELSEPIKIENLLNPGETYEYSLPFVVPEPSTEQSKNLLSLNLFLTNPARNNEKFGDGLIVIIEILPKIIP